METGVPGLVERRACPACGASAVERAYPTETEETLAYDSPELTRYLDQFYGGRVDHTLLASAEYEVMRCQSCGLRYQREVPDQELLRVLYDEWIDIEVSKATKARREPHLQAEYRRLLDHLAAAAQVDPVGSTLLDLGMGWGAFARAAIARGFHVIGVEVSEERRSAAVESGIEVLAPEALADGVLDRRVDIAVANQVFEHLIDPVSAADAMHRSLRTGGIAHVEVPNGADRRIGRLLAHGDWAAPKNTRWSLNPVAPLEHVNCWTAKSLRAVLVDVGLKPLRWVEQQRLQPPSSLRSKLMATGAFAVTARRVD